MTFRPKKTLGYYNDRTFVISNANRGKQPACQRAVKYVNRVAVGMGSIMTKAIDKARGRRAAQERQLASEAANKHN